MTTVATTTYQGMLQRMQALVNPLPTTVAQPAAPPAMAGDTYVRAAGFMPPTGYFQAGNYGPQVGALQAQLGSLGYLAGTPDQFYANGTIEAVKYFQLDYGLPPTGLFDMASYQAMMAVFAGQLPWKRGQAVVQPTPQPRPEPPVQPAPSPQLDPQPKPTPKPEPAKAEALKGISPAELSRLGATDKKRFFEVLRPAAEAAEREYGVPAAITLAQAALETGWGQHIIPGYNIFGIKGTGPAGTVSKKTWEHYNGKDVTITANFAKYHNFYEAVFEHGKFFHRHFYTKAMNEYKQNRDPFRFAQNITGIYATDPNYGKKLSSIMREYQLV